MLGVRMVIVGWREWEVMQSLEGVWRRGLAPGTLLFLQVSAGYMDVHFVKIHQAMHF